MEKGRHSVAPSRDSVCKEGSECKVESGTSGEQCLKPQSSSLYRMLKSIKIRSAADGTSARTVPLPSARSRPTAPLCVCSLCNSISELAACDAHGIHTCARPVESASVWYLINIFLRACWGRPAASRPGRPGVDCRSHAAGAWLQAHSTAKLESGSWQIALASFATPRSNLKLRLLPVAARGWAGAGAGPGAST